MPRQNTLTAGSAVNLRTAAQSIRAAAASGTFEDLKSALTQAASAFDSAQSAIEIVEARFRDLAQPNTNVTGRQTPVTVSGDRIIGGVSVQGGIARPIGQSLDLALENQVATVVAQNHQTGNYLELDITARLVQVIGAPDPITGLTCAVIINSAPTVGTAFVNLYADRIVFTGNAVPALDNTYVFGTAAKRWTDAHLMTATIYALPTYANNAAALVGGLTAGQLYRTAAGAVMVTF